MTTENELDILQTIDTSEKQVELNKEEPIAPQVEHEQTSVEKPKRGGRKKRDGNELKTENSILDYAMDTQPLFEQPVILEGKRSRKPTSRLELSDLATPKKELSIPQGHGKPLGEIEYINYQITHASTDALSRMRNICFGRRGSNMDIRKNLRDFNGFEFDRTSEEYQRHLSSLTKLRKEQLRSLADILGLSITDRQDEIAERILTFLMSPVDEGKAIPERKMSMRTKKQSSTNSKESFPTDEDENDLADKAENGNDEEDDELFDVNDEEVEEDDGTDDDYIGSDEDSGLNTKDDDDDPDDFAYQPGKKVPKKRTPMKRSRSKSTPKRKRGASTRSSKRGRKKSKVPVVKSKVENEPSTNVSTDAMQTTNDDSEKVESIPETKNDDLNNVDMKSSEQIDTTTTTTTTTTPTADIVPTTD